MYPLAKKENIGYNNQVRYNLTAAVYGGRPTYGVPRVVTNSMGEGYLAYTVTMVNVSGLKAPQCCNEACCCIAVMFNIAMTFYI